MHDDPIEFFDLAGKTDDLRFSPYCWKTRMALAHKGLPVRTIPWRYCDKTLIAFTGQGAVPVIRHNGRGIHDSWEIALYLEENFPEGKVLFGGGEAIALTRFINTWVDTALIPLAARVIMLNVHDAMRDSEQAYFRSTREERFGMPLEELVRDRPGNLEKWRVALGPLRRLRADQPFLGGPEPLYADYCVFGMFMWMRGVTHDRLLEDSDPILPWYEAMLDLFDGLARARSRCVVTAQSAGRTFKRQILWRWTKPVRGRRAISPGRWALR